MTARCLDRISICYMTSESKSTHTHVGEERRRRKNKEEKVEEEKKEVEETGSRHRDEIGTTSG